MAEQSIDLQSEQFMTLLTDALRTGPGSPEWHQAVRILRASNQNVDEFTLLYSARENLESGKSYRAVAAGPEFTKKVFDGIETQGGPPRSGVPTAGIIGIVSAVVVIGVVAIVAYLATRGGGTGKPQPTDELNTIVFGNRSVTTFTGTAVPPDWRKIGEVPLTVSGGQLRPGMLLAAASTSTSAPVAGTTSEYKTGGIVTAVPIAADIPIEATVTLRVSRASDDGVVQVFVSDTPVDDDHATGLHELVWLFQGGQAKVFLPNGRAEGVAEKLPGVRDIPVKLILNRDLVVVESAGKRLYGGPHQLASGKSRYIGVRFLRKAGEKWDHLGVVSIALAKP